MVDPYTPQEFIVCKNNDGQESIQGFVVGDWSQKIFTLEKEFKPLFELEKEIKKSNIEEKDKIIGENENKFREINKIISSNNQNEIEEIVEKCFELMPDIAEAYKANGWEMGIFFLDNATAEIRNMMEIEESYEFKY